MLVQLWHKLFRRPREINSSDPKIDRRFSLDTRWEGVLRGEANDLQLSPCGKLAVVLSVACLDFLDLRRRSIVRRIILEGHVEPLCACWVGRFEVAVACSSGVLLTIGIDKVGSNRTPKYYCA